MASKYDKHRDTLTNLLKQNNFQHITAARLFAKDHGLKGRGGNTLILYVKKLRKQLLAGVAADPPAVVENKNTTQPNDYNQDEFFLSAWDYDKKRLLSPQEFCEKYNLPADHLTSYKFLPHHYKEPTYHLVFKQQYFDTTDLTPEFIEAAILKHTKPVKFTASVTGNTRLFDRLVYSDVHIGMEPNQDGHSLYGGRWDAGKILDRCKRMVQKVIEQKKGSVIYVDDLGDLMDGWDGKTVRRQHDLPQNMNNQQAFDCALAFKMLQVDLLVQHYSQVIFHNVCEDNHAGAFGYVVNSAFKMLAETKYPQKVTVVNHQKFIDHYFVGRHCFVITHGKDSKNLKTGFKPWLDKTGEKKIDLYLKDQYIYRSAEFIEFSKGDSHQMLLDYCTSDHFDYFNYPAFSVASSWVQTNFQKGRSGFVLQHVSYQDNHKVVVPYFFKDEPKNGTKPGTDKKES